MRVFALLVCLLVASVASASSLFLDGSGSASLGPGDQIDNVILINQAHVDVSTGAIIGQISLLDESTADIFGGTISGDLEAFEGAVITVHGENFTADGNPTTGPLTVLDCPTCAFSGTLMEGDALAVTGEVAQAGQIVLVPEPAPVLLMGLGLFGLGVLAWRRPLTI